MKIIIGLRDGSVPFLKECPEGQHIHIEFHNYCTDGIESDMILTDDNGANYWIEDELSR